MTSEEAENETFKSLTSITLLYLGSFILSFKAVDDRDSNIENSKITQLIPKLEKIDQVEGVYSDEDEGDDVDSMPELNEIDVGDFPKGIKKKKKKRRKSYINRDLLIHKRKLNVNARD